MDEWFWIVSRGVASDTGEEEAGAVFCINDVAEEIVGLDDLDWVVAASDVAGKLGRESLSGPRVPDSVLTSASSEVFVSALCAMVDSFGLSIIARRNPKSREIMAIAANQVGQYPADESSKPPTIGPKKAPVVIIGPITPIVFPMALEPTVSAIVANDAIQSTDAAAPWKIRLKYNQTTECKSSAC